MGSAWGQQGVSKGSTRGQQGVSMGSAASCWDPLDLTNLKQALKYFKILSQRKSTYLKIVWLITHSYIHVMCFGANTEWNWIENDVLNKCLILFLFFVSKLKRQQHSIKCSVGHIVIPEEVAVVTVWYFGKNPHIILNHCYNRIRTSTFQYCLCGQCSSSSVRFYESPQIKVSNWNVKFIGLDGRKKFCGRTLKSDPGAQNSKMSGKVRFKMRWETQEKGHKRILA